MNNNEAIKTLKETYMLTKARQEALDIAIKALENEPKKGKKVIKNHYGWLFCSECDKIVEHHHNFCWFCGADIRR